MRCTSVDTLFHQDMWRSIILPFQGISPAVVSPVAGIDAGFPPWIHARALLCAEAVEAEGFKRPLSHPSSRWVGSLAWGENSHQSSAWKRKIWGVEAQVNRCSSRHIFLIHLCKHKPNPWQLRSHNCCFILQAPFPFWTCVLMLIKVLTWLMCSSSSLRAPESTLLSAKSLYNHINLSYLIIDRWWLKRAYDFLQDALVPPS